MVTAITRLSLSPMERRNLSNRTVVASFSVFNGAFAGTGAAQKPWDGSCPASFVGTTVDTFILSRISRNSLPAGRHIRSVGLAGNQAAAHGGRRLDDRSYFEAVPAQPRNSLAPAG